jgi:hypothetical protein
MIRANYMQRVFDILKASPDLLTVARICELGRLEHGTVLGALKRLRADRALTSVCQNGMWRYGLRAHAIRPRGHHGNAKERATA